MQGDRNRGQSLRARLVGADAAVAGLREQYARAQTAEALLLAALREIADGDEVRVGCADSARARSFQRIARAAIARAEEAGK